MKQGLQDILDALDSDEPVDGDAIRKSVKSISEGLDVLEFKLKRSEKIKRTTAVFLDESVTELEEKRKAVEEINAALEQSLVELRATQAQLVEQEKLASLGALTAGIAHEIKNPLNFVNNFAEVSGELSQEIIEALEAGDPEEARKIAGELTINSEQITKHGKRADSIVRSMMQHAKGGVSEREEVELNTYLEEYLNLAWHGMRARDDGFTAEIIRELDPSVETISAMPQELGRVILNLLNNAFDAVSKTENAAVTVATRALDEAVEITVSDNGPGIPLEIREKIFEPFFTTKATGEGTGLGLSLSHDIITKGHGGTMTVNESKSGGASFVLTLPKR